MASQDSYVEYDIKPFDDGVEYTKFISELYGLYSDFDEVYEKVEECINEIRKYEKGSKEYVIKKGQISEYSNMIVQLAYKEFNIFAENQVLLDGINHYIAKKYGIPKNIKINTINIHTAYSRKELKEIKENRYLLRLINSISYHKRLFNFTEEKEEELGFITLPDAKEALPVTMEDLSNLGLLATLLDNCGDKDYGYFIRLYSFTNVYFEYFFTSLSENYFMQELKPVYYEGEEEFTDHNIPIILNILYTVQDNIIIDKNLNNPELFKNRLSAKEKVKIFVNYNKESDFYDSGFEKVRKIYKNNVREITVLDAYLEQLYQVSDPETINKLDKKLQCLSCLSKMYDKDFINPKVYYGFFRNLDLIEKKINKSEMQRKRKMNKKKNDEEDDSE